MGSIQKVQQAGRGGGVEDIHFFEKNLEFLRGCRQIRFVQLTGNWLLGQGELIEVVVCKSMDEI